MIGSVMKKIFVGVVAVLLLVINPGSAIAKTTVTGGPYTNLALTGQVITLKLSGYPVNSGFYLMQCLNASNSTRPSVCNPSGHLWISSSVGASFGPNADIQFKPVAKFTYGTKNVDCTKASCGIFMRLDHTATADRSEDQFIPLTFIGATPAALPSDVIRATVGNRVIQGDGAMTVRYGDAFKIDATTRSGVAVTFSTTSTGCVVVGNQVSITKGYGSCDVTMTSLGNAQYAGTTKHYTFRIKVGIQKVVVNTTVKAGTTLVLPSTSNFGGKVTYDLSATDNCALTSNQGTYSVVFKKIGACTVKAAANELKDTYAEMNQTVRFKIQ